MKSNYEAYYEAPQSIRDLIDSGVIGDAVEKILTGTNYSNLKSKIIISCTRFFLSIISENELKEELRALTITDDMIQKLTTTTKQLLTETLHTISESIESIAAEVSSIEENLDFKPPLVQEPTSEVVYTTTQSAILQEGKQAQTTIVARWDSAK
jgi:hypothetical protein